MKTTLKAMYAHNPSESGWKRLLEYLNKTTPDDAPLSLLTILDISGIDDALWALRAVEGYDREKYRYTMWCALQLTHYVVAVAERCARRLVTPETLVDVRTAFSFAMRSISCGCAWAAVKDVSWWAVVVASKLDAQATAIAAQTAEFRRMCECIDAGVDPYPEANS